MDENKENIFLNKLNNSSKTIFFKCLNTLNNEDDVKIAFYNFLFGDLITLEINENKLNEINAELKTVNINLEENIENHDYKKFSINKLRNIVVEKGLSTDASKLKKNEILKLLGAE